MRRLLPAIPLSTALLLGSLASSATSAQPILPPDAAARPFLEARTAILDGQYAEAVPKLEQALATGHTRPQERFGTSRQSVDYYDPHYWLGRALMELGEDARAAAELKASLAAGLIVRHAEYPDLVARLAELDRREAARREALRPPQQPPEPTPTPVTARTAAAPPGEEARAVRPARERTVALPTPAPVATPERGSALRDAVGALSTGNDQGFELTLARARAEEPGSAAPDLLEAVSAATRYLLGGKRDEALLARARRLLAAYHGRGGSRKAEAIWLSPPLRALLERP